MRSFAAGIDNFELDHFRPKADPRFSALVADYYNLYYSCHVCNKYKAATWPSTELIERGYYFVDLCKELFSGHFQEEVGGEWSALSRAGDSRSTHSIPAGQRSSATSSASSSSSIWNVVVSNLHSGRVHSANTASNFFRSSGISRCIVLALHSKRTPQTLWPGELIAVTAAAET